MISTDDVFNIDIYSVIQKHSHFRLNKRRDRDVCVATLKMPTSVRMCIICEKTAATSRQLYMKIKSDVVAAKIRHAYRRQGSKDPPNSILGESVHRKCYKRLVKNMPSVRPSRENDRQLSLSENNEVTSMNSSFANRNVFPFRMYSTWKVKMTRMMVSTMM
jgi:hypothetical protein